MIVRCLGGFASGGGSQPSKVRKVCDARSGLPLEHSGLGVLHPPLVVLGEPVCDEPGVELLHGAALLLRNHLEEVQRRYREPCQELLVHIDGGPIHQSGLLHGEKGWPSPRSAPRHAPAYDSAPGTLPGGEKAPPNRGHRHSPGGRQGGLLCAPAHPDRLHLLRHHHSHPACLGRMRVMMEQDGGHDAQGAGGAGSAHGGRAQAVRREDR
mmetsp:Transcript_29579/g.94927  ORF Transcript_29579/g.94927 Transcript_29579/m.94927 type:complete len:210 (+) Transcript_29579:4167-4796(+)